MSATEGRIDPELDELLRTAAETCRDALADYRAGLLDVEELRSTLVGGGLVRSRGEVWLLDLEADRWWHYDGVAVGIHAESATSTALGHLRDVIHELNANSYASTHRGTT